MGPLGPKTFTDPRLTGHVGKREGAKDLKRSYAMAPRLGPVELSAEFRERAA